MRRTCGAKSQSRAPLRGARCACQNAAHPTPQVGISGRETERWHIVRYIPPVTSSKHLGNEQWHPQKVIWGCITGVCSIKAEQQLLGRALHELRTASSCVTLAAAAAALLPGQELEGPPHQGRTDRHGVCACSLTENHSRSFCTACVGNDDAIFQ